MVELLHQPKKKDVFSSSSEVSALLHTFSISLSQSSHSLLTPGINKAFSFHFELLLTVYILTSLEVQSICIIWTYKDGLYFCKSFFVLV